MRFVADNLDLIYTYNGGKYQNGNEGKVCALRPRYFTLKYGLLKVSYCLPELFEIE